MRVVSLVILTAMMTFLFWVLLIGRAMSMETCAAREVQGLALFNEFKEVAVVQGISREGILLEIFMGPKRAWTLLYTIPGGPSCLIAAGEMLNINMQEANNVIED